MGAAHCLGQPKDDIMEVAIEGLDHMIHTPRELYVEEEGGELSSLEVIDANGARSIKKTQGYADAPCCLTIRVVTGS